MKYLISALFFGFVCITSFMLIASASPMEKTSLNKLTDQDSETVRVMSFNLRLDTESDGPNAWPHRKEMVARVLRFHEADFVGIQEGLPHQLTELDDLLPYFDRIGVGRTGDEENPGEFSAIFYRKDRFELLDNDTFWLSETPNEPGSVGWDAMLPRIVTWGEFRDTVNGETFYVFNTHFDHVGETARAESASLILEKIAEIAGDQSIVLTGDFNTTENDPPYKVLTGSMGDPEVQLEDGFYHAEHGHHGPTSTWNGFEEILPNRRIDFVFTNPGFNIVQHAILADHQDGRFPSDHLPVVADIRFAE